VSTGPSAPDPFLRRLASTDGVTVDIGRIANASIHLSTMAAAVSTEIRDAARQADQSMRVGRYEQSALGDQAITEVPAIDRRLRHLQQVVDSNLDGIAKTLQETAAAIQRIAARYHGTEQLNQATAAEVARMLPKLEEPRRG